MFSLTDSSCILYWDLERLRVLPRAHSWVGIKLKLVLKSPVLFSVIFLLIRFFFCFLFFVF